MGFFFSGGEKDKNRVSNYITCIIPIGPGRRYALSICSTTTLQPLGFCQHDFDFFAIFASCLCSKVNFLQFAANLSPVHYLRNGPAFFLWCLLSPFVLYLHEVSSYQRSPAEISAWLIISAQLRPGVHRCASSGVQRRAVPCPAVRYCAMLCCILQCFAVLCCAVLCRAVPC